MTHKTKDPEIDANSLTTSTFKTTAFGPPFLCRNNNLILYYSSMPLKKVNDIAMYTRSLKKLKLPKKNLFDTFHQFLPHFFRCV